MTNRPTAEERAKICLPGCYDPIGRECSADYRCEIHYRVAEQIRLVEEAAYETGKKEIREACSQHQHNQYAQGFAECQEQMKKIIPTNPAFNMLATITYLDLAKFIYALTPSEGLSDEAKADMKKFHKADGGRE